MTHASTARPPNFSPPQKNRPPTHPPSGYLFHCLLGHPVEPLTLRIPLPSGGCSAPNLPELNHSQLHAVRAVLHTRERSRHAAEAARLGVLREVVTHASKSEGVPEASLRTAVRIATGSEPTERDLARRVAEFGGEPVVTDEGAIRYRFPELESDAEAASEDRAKAPASEAALGAIAYDTDR